MIVTDERAAAFVGERLGMPIIPPFTCFGVEKNGQIVGAVLFNIYTGPDIEVSVAGDPGVFKRDFIRQLGEYVFQRLHCIRVSVTTESPAVVRMVERLGGQIEGMKRNQFGPGRDGFILGILKDEWKFR